MRAIWKHLHFDAHQHAYGDFTFDDRLGINIQFETADHPGIDTVYSTDQNGKQGFIIAPDFGGQPGSIWLNLPGNPDQFAYI